MHIHYSHIYCSEDNYDDCHCLRVIPMTHLDAIAVDAADPVADNGGVHSAGPAEEDDTRDGHVVLAPDGVAEHGRAGPLPGRCFPPTLYGW